MIASKEEMEVVTKCTMPTAELKLRGDVEEGTVRAEPRISGRYHSPHSSSTVYNIVQYCVQYSAVLCTEENEDDVPLSETQGSMSKQLQTNKHKNDTRR